jgi:hypothetical protein
MRALLSWGRCPYTDYELRIEPQFAELSPGPERAGPTVSSPLALEEGWVACERVVHVDAGKVIGRGEPRTELVHRRDVHAAWRCEVGKRRSRDPLGQGMLGAVPRIEAARHATHERA